MRKLNFVFVLMFLILSVGMVGAVPPVTTEFVGNEGLDIQANVLDYYKINTSAELHIHIFNISNGGILTNTSVDCSAELTDKTGAVVFSGNPAPHDDHFLIMRNSSVVTEVGVYGLTIVCNSSGVGGAKTSFFEATANGEAPADSLIVVAFCLVLLLILSSSLVMIIKAVGHIIDKNFDLMDMGIMWGAYFCLLGINQLAIIYLGNVDVNNWLDLFVSLYAFPMVVVPIIAFLLSLFNMNKEKKERAKQW